MLYRRAMALPTHRNLIFYGRCYIKGGHRLRRPVWLFAHGASASNMDIYGALFTGAKLCAFEIKEQSFAAMADWIDGQKLTLLHTVPTAARELCGSIAPERRFDSVRVVDLAGEMLFGSDVARMRPHFGDDCTIFNRLAATEASFIGEIGHQRPRAAEGGCGRTPPRGSRCIVRADARPPRAAKPERSRFRARTSQPAI